MKLTTKILSLKSIKIGFDIVFVFLILLLSVFLILSILDIGFFNITKGQIATEVNAERLVENNSVDIFSSIDKTKVDSKISGYRLNLDLKDSNFKGISIVYQLINYFTLSLSIFLIIFIVFHIRKILKSIIREINRNTNTEFKHCIFNNENIRRFRYIGISFIIVPLIDLFLYKFQTYFISKYLFVKESGMELKPIAEYSDISWDYIYIGLLFLSIIEIIRKGMVIQEENDLTV